MSTLEALNAISEAIEAHKILPDIQRQLKEAREAHDFAMLELDEARNEIEKLKSQRDYWQEMTNQANDTLREERATISELRDRNNSLDNNLTDLTVSYRNIELDRNEKVIVIDMQRDEINRLEAALEANKSLTSRLTDTLRSIGASIVAAVEVPEVTSESPFPVPNPVGLPDPAPTSLDGGDSHGVGEYVAEPTDADLVGVAEDNSSTFNTAPGTNVYKYW
jgi:vacuolar-type H+-ATPase subunit I/STV1